jgi:predicted NodU family carbamoyl transferase
MVIIGISGFERDPGAPGRHLYGEDKLDTNNWFRFQRARVPLQFFPLDLIGHDAGAALLVDGELIASAAEERFTRIKHGINLAGRTVLPRRAMRYCLEQASLEWSDVDYWAHYCRFTPDTVANRLRRVAAGLDPLQRAAVEEEYRHAYSDRLARQVVRRQLEAIADRPIAEDRLVQVRHHVAHAAGAFFSSDFDEAICLSLDGYGEEESCLWAVGQKTSVRPEGIIPLPSSLGMLYQVVTAYLGFRTFGDEYKVMGLSSYGDPQPFRSIFDELVVLAPDGGYVTAFSRPDLGEWLGDELGEIPNPGGFSRKSADIAAALQRKLEQSVLHTAAFLRERYGIDRLCISGGVGLNACANGAIVRSGLFKNVFVQPAASDDGASLGAGLFVWHERGEGRRSPAIRHVYWGPSHDGVQIEDALRNCRSVTWKKKRDPERRAAQLLADEKIVGWFQGRMEMGPRALGARSILASPSSVAVRDRLNELVKGRESFRPFAPSVMAEEAAEYFVIPDDTSAAFMIVTFPTRDGVCERIPGVVHVDGSARVHLVRDTDNPRFYRVLRFFRELTGLPVLLNTSFNRAGEPVVESPDDALRCFARSGLDALVIGDYVAFPAAPAAGELT